MNESNLNEAKSFKKSKKFHITFHIIISLLPVVVLFLGTIVGTIIEAFFLSKQNYVGIPASIIIFPVIAFAMYLLLAPISMIIQSIYCLIRFKVRNGYFYLISISLNTINVVVFITLSLILYSAISMTSSSAFAEENINSTPAIASLLSTLVLFLPIISMFVHLVALSISRFEPKNAL